MKTWLIKKLASWLYGITADQWDLAIVRVHSLMESDISGETKRGMAQQTLRTKWPKIKTAALNWLIESAVGIVRKKLGLQ